MAETIQSRYTFSTSNIASQHVSFKSGVQADLNKFMLGGTNEGQANEGTFYLTTDTHRLYIGRKITASGSTTYASGSEPTIPIPINEGIQYVESLDDLQRLATEANAGEFYYVGGNANILAVYNGQQWVQINPDTDNNDTIRVSSISIQSSTLSSTATLIYDLTLNQIKTNKDGATTTMSPVVTSFSIDRAAITGDVSVGLSTTSVESNQASLQLTGGNTAPNYQINLHSTSGISLTVSNNNITIKGNPYTLSTTVVSNKQSSITLKDGDGQEQTGYIVAGDQLDIATNATAGYIVLNHSSPGTAVSTFGSTSNVTLQTGQSFIIPHVEIDNKGHITTATNITVSYPQFSITANNSGNLIIKEYDGHEISSTTSVLYHTINIDGTTQTIYNQNNLGSFYSASGVDALIEQHFQQFNAMTYKGTVGSNESTVQSGNLYTVTSVAIGDVYMVDTNGSSIWIGSTTAITCNRGDLLIANGEEENGIITSGLVWDIIPGGSVNTTYTLSAQTFSSNGDVRHNQGIIRLSANTGEDNDIPIYGISDEYIQTAVISSTSESGIRISHKTSGVTSGTYGAATTIATTLNWNTGNSFILPRLNVDSYGHITSATNVTYTLPTLEEYSVTNVDRGVAGTHVILKNSDGGDCGIVNFSAGSKLSVTATSGSIIYAHNSITSTSGTTTSIFLGSSSELNVITGLEFDGYGHITSYTNTPIKVHTYSLRFNDNNNMVLQNDDGNTISTWSFTSPNATIDITTGTASNNRNYYNFDILWGSF